MLIFVGLILRVNSLMISYMNNGFTIIVSFKEYFDKNENKNH